MANSGVNVKMGVSGIAQFKQSINTAKNSVKTLDAQLALNEKQFKASGDAETYMQTKTELLQKKMEEQRSVIEQTEKALEQMTTNGVERTSSAFQSMEQQLAAAKSSLLDTETALGNIGTAAEDADTGLFGLQDGLNKLNQKVSFATVTEGIDRITSGIEAAARKAWELGSALVRNTLGAGEWADELATTAAQYEISPEELYRMRQTARLIDTDAETILAAQAKLKKNIGAGGSGTTDALEALGLGTIVETDPEEQFWKIGEAIMGLGDAYERENAAQALFGKSWRELLPLFQAGREEYDKTKKSWSWIGDDALEDLTKMDDQYQKMQAEFETFKIEMLSAFSGPLTEGMETITALVKEFNKYLETPEGREALAQIGETVSGLISDLTKIDPEQAVAGLQGVLTGITDAFKWIDEHHQEVITAVEAIFIGWGALKLTGGALKLMELVNGITGLTGASAAAAGTVAGASWASAFASAAMAAAPFLAFLYTLLDPSATSDKIGNNELWDANGNPTTEAKRQGIDMTQEEFDQYGQNQTGPVMIDAWHRTNVPTTGETTDYVRTPNHALEELQSRIDQMTEATEETSKSTKETKEKGVQVPDLDRAARMIVSKFTNLAVYLDGQKVGEMTAPYVSEELAGWVLGD